MSLHGGGQKDFTALRLGFPDFRSADRNVNNENFRFTFGEHFGLSLNIIFSIFVEILTI